MSEDDAPGSESQRTEELPIEAAGGVERAPAPTLRVRFVAPVVLLVVLAGALALYARNDRVLSPYDEQQHLDYAVKAGDLRLPNNDEQLGAVAMRETACRGIDTPGIVLPACDSDVFDPAAFPDFGYNTAAGALPGYYFPSGLLGRAIEAATPVSSPLLAIRIVSAIWFALGVAVLLVVGREFGATRLQTGVVAVLLAATPLMMTSGAKATPDSMLFLTGAVVLLATTRWLRGRIGLWAPATAAVLAMVVDRSNLLALALAGLFAVTMLFGGQHPEEHPRWPRRNQPIDAAPAGALLLGAFVTAVLVAEYFLPAFRELLTNSTGALAVDLPRFESQQRPPFSRSVFLGSFTNMVSPVDQGYLPGLTRDETYRSLTALVNWMVIAGALGTAAWAPAGSMQRRLGAAASITMVLSGPMLSFGQWMLGGLYFGLPARYGLPMLPALAVTLALSLRGRTLTVVVGTIAAAQFALFVYRTANLS